MITANFNTLPTVNVELSDSQPSQFTVEIQSPNQVEVFFGIKGDQGVQGLKGDTGQQGLKGDTGNTGNTGASFGIYYLGNYIPTNGYVTNIAVVRGSDSQLYLAKASGQLGNPIDWQSNGQWEIWLPKGVKGDNGDQGNAGTAGADALWNFVGAYSGGAAYAVGDVATFDGQLWYRLNSNGGNVGDTPSEGFIWTLLAKKGEDGQDLTEGAYLPLVGGTLTGNVSISQTLGQQTIDSIVFNGGGASQTTSGRIELRGFVPDGNQQVNYSSAIFDSYGISGYPYATSTGDTGTWSLSQNEVRGSDIVAGTSWSLGFNGLQFPDGTTQTTAIFTNQIVTNSSVVNMKTFPHSVVLAENDAGIVYSLSKQLRDFIHTEGSNGGVKNYTLDGFGIDRFESVGVLNVRTVALTNMPNLHSVKVANTGTIENINFDGSIKVTYLNLSGLTFSTTNMSNMVSNFVMRNADNTLFLTNLNLVGAIPSTWYNDNTSKLGIENVAVNNLSFINPTTLPNLKWLRIGNNVPASLPNINFGSFTHLETLYARERGVDGINTFSLPTSIKAVDLSNSIFYDFDASMSNLTLPNLISINFSNCNLYSAEFVPINAGLKYLNLYGNNFGSNPSDLTALLDAVDALNESGLISTDKHKELNFTGTNMPVFTSTPTSVTNLRSRGYYVYGNGL